MKELIERYFRAWVDADADTVKELFCDDIVYSECYGPEYHGLSQILMWFEDWNSKGRVLEWDIKRIIEHGDTIIAEWWFKCEYCGNTDGTIADIKDGKIHRPSEFQSDPDHYYPYGE